MGELWRTFGVFIFNLEMLFMTIYCMQIIIDRGILNSYGGWGELGEGGGGGG